jgi:hypothetical protein
MAKKNLEIVNFAEIESLRRNFNTDLSLQTMDDKLKADLRLEFEDWINNWARTAYRVGVTVPDLLATEPNVQIVN